MRAGKGWWVGRILGGTADGSLTHDDSDPLLGSEMRDAPHL
jgi:hypothetical protein